MNLRSEEERCSRLREELLTVREDLNKALLSRDVLEQHRAESDNLMIQLEKAKGKKEPNMSNTKFIGDLQYFQSLLSRSHTGRDLLRGDTRRGALSVSIPAWRITAQ